MKIFLVRHAAYHNPDTIYPFHLPVPLSEDGRKHAQRVGEWFQSQKIFKLPIFTSPIQRAVETAEAISEKTQSDIQKDDRLIETYSEGLQGKKQSEDWKFEFDDPTRESKESVLKRVLNIYNEKIEEGEDCIFVSHGDPLTLLWYFLVKKEMPHYVWDPANIDVIKRGEIVEIDIENGFFKALKRYIV